MEERGGGATMLLEFRVGISEGNSGLVVLPPLDIAINLENIDGRFWGKSCDELSGDSISDWIGLTDW